MTSNDQRTEPISSDEDALPLTDPGEQRARRTESTRVDGGFDSNAVQSVETTPPGTHQPRGVDGNSTSDPTDSGRPDVESSSEKPLFADDLLASLQARWGEVQAIFVDDPRACVQKADGLVSDVVGQLVTGFADARSHLERQWSRGEEASTEDLRVALKRYREFFDRLLKV